MQTKAISGQSLAIKSYSNAEIIIHPIIPPAIATAMLSTLLEITESSVRVERVALCTIKRPNADIAMHIKSRVLFVSLINKPTLFKKDLNLIPPKEQV